MRLREEQAHLKELQGMFSTSNTTTTTTATTVPSSSTSQQHHAPTLKFSTHSLSIHTHPSSTGDGAGGGMGIPQVPSLSIYIRPQQVVKRTVRRVKDDGSEVIDVTYLLAPEEIDRVQREAKRKEAQSLVSKAGGGRRQLNYAYDDDDTGRQRKDPGDLKIKLKLVCVYAYHIYCMYHIYSITYLSTPHINAQYTIYHAYALLIIILTGQAR